VPADLELLHEEEPMYEPAAAWTKDFHQPCLHAEQDSPLGACTVTAGAPARDLMANLAGEEEAHRSCCSGSCRGRTSCGRAGRSARTRCRASGTVRQPEPGAEKG
jgi:hypothetical protein